MRYLDDSEGGGEGLPHEPPAEYVRSSGIYAAVIPLAGIICLIIYLFALREAMQFISDLVHP